MTRVLINDIDNEEVFFADYDTLTEENKAHLLEGIEAGDLEVSRYNPGSEKYEVLQSTEDKIENWLEVDDVYQFPEVETSDENSDDSNDDSDKPSEE